MSDERSAEQAFRELVRGLHAAGRLRVWSIIISIFGDLVLPRRNLLPASVLQALTDRLEIERGAVRTALSRLGKEGWITRVRNGRNVAYQLSDAAIPEFSVAAKTIYAAKRPVPTGDPKLVILPDGADPPDTTDLMPLRRGVMLWTGTGHLPDRLRQDALITEGRIDRVPDWVREAVAPSDLASHYRALMQRFGDLERALGDGALPSLDSAVARVLLIHSWRRVALRHPFVTDDLLPEDWPEPQCRQFVGTLHAKLTIAAKPWLDDTLGMPDIQEVVAGTADMLR